MPYVICVFRGPAHVLVSVSDSWDSHVHLPPPIGLPAREAWSDDGWRTVQRRMDVVYRTGVPETLPLADGEMTLTPYPSGVVPALGVVTAHARADSPEYALRHPEIARRLRDPLPVG